MAEGYYLRSITTQKAVYHWNAVESEQDLVRISTLYEVFPSTRVAWRVVRATVIIHDSPTIWRHGFLVLIPRVFGS